MSRDQEAANVYIDIVIVNWNGGQMLDSCIQSIIEHDYKDIRVIIVDNGSTDKSIERLDTKDPRIKVIELGKNLGFAKACNVGAFEGHARYILFLNPDTELHAGSLKATLEFMDSQAAKQVGICGVKLIDDDGQVALTCARFPSIRTFLGRALGVSKALPKIFPPHYMIDFDHQQNRFVDEVMGAYFLVRRSLFEQLQGFDEQYFVYFEELDFALRARHAGWQTYFLSTASVYHKGGGISSQVKAHRLFYSLRSRMLYGFKHMGLVGGLVIVLITLLLEPVTRLMHALLRGSWSDVHNTLKGYMMLYRDMPGVFQKALCRP